MGELAEGPDSAFDVKLKWTDTGETSSWMKLHSLDGEPLKLPLQSPFEGEHLDLAHQQLDPGYVLLLSWWLGTEFSAALTKIDVRATELDPESLEVLKAAASQECEVLCD